MTGSWWIYGSTMKSPVSCHSNRAWMPGVPIVRSACFLVGCSFLQGCCKLETLPHLVASHCAVLHILTEPRTPILGCHIAKRTPRSLFARPTIKIRYSRNGQPTLVPPKWAKMAVRRVHESGILTRHRGSVPKLKEK